MKGKQGKIIVAGHISYDMTPAFEGTGKSSLAELLKPGKLVNVGKMVAANGGCVNNTGMALHKFGADVILVAKIGEDDIGKQIMENCKRKGARIRFILSKEEDTSYTIVLSPPGRDRSFLHYSGSNDRFVPEDLDLSLMEAGDWFHFGYPTLMKGMYRDGGRPLASMFENLREMGLYTSMDVAAIDPESEAGREDWISILKRTLPHVDVFTPSFEELFFMMDRRGYENWMQRHKDEDMCMQLSLEKDIKPLAKRTMELGCGMLLLKCGAAGMYLETAPACQNSLGMDASYNGMSYFQKSYRPDRIASAAGAGDTSIAAFLYGITRGYDAKKSLRLAAGTGASCITEYDTYSGLLSMEELEARLEAG